jgi:hypothetical protein
LTLVWICLWAAIALTFLFFAVSQWTGLDPAPDAEAANGGIMIVIIAGALTVGGLVRFRGLRADHRRLNPPPRQDGAPKRITVEDLSRREGRPLLPAPGSAARAPMRRLADAEATLTELLARLTESRAAPADGVATARDAAADAAARMREIAETLQSVEQAVEHASAAERNSVQDGVRRLREQLDLDLDRYGDLIAAVSRVLIATAATPSTADLTDATDHLTGLAQALRELSES